MSIAEKLTAIAENVLKVFIAGRTAERRFFWGKYQNDGEKSDYRHAFAGYGWTDETFNPDFPFGKMKNCLNMFSYSRVTRIDYDLDASEAGQISGMFANCSLLTYIKSVTFGENHTATSVVFSSCPNLVHVIVKGVINFTVTFVSSTKLDKESIGSIMGVLSDSATGKTVTFSKTAVDNAYETSEGAADGSDSEEWATLVAAKPNWTINLG